MLNFLNDKDRDILFLIFVSRKKQKDVQKILDRIQTSLCYDIKRIRRRLWFIVYLHRVFDIFINFITQKAGHFTQKELGILTLMFYTSSFTLTSSIMKISQVKVRYAFNKCLCRMEELAESASTKKERDEWWAAYEIFTIIRANLNIVKRVYRLKPGSESLPVV